MWLCVLGVSRAYGPGLRGLCPVCSRFLTLSVSFSQPPKLKKTHTGGKGRGCWMIRDGKGVREPLYIYGLCRTGGSGVVKWSRAPKPSLNSKYITDSGIRGDGKKNQKAQIWSIKTFLRITGDNVSIIKQYYNYNVNSRMNTVSRATAQQLGAQYEYIVVCSGGGSIQMFPLNKSTPLCKNTLYLSSLSCENHVSNHVKRTVKSREP